MTEGLPDGFRVRVGDGVRVLDGGRTLVGGSPLRVLRLKAPAPPVTVGTVLEVSDPATRTVAERLLAANLARSRPRRTVVARRGQRRDPRPGPG